jgi:hypothetical protein
MERRTSCFCGTDWLGRGEEKMVLLLLLGLSGFTATEMLGRERECVCMSVKGARG